MLFVNLFAVLLLLGGPIVGYQVAIRRRAPRWKVITWCTAGGAVAAVVLIGVMLFQYALIGLVLGFAAVATPEAMRQRVYTTGLVCLAIVGVSFVVRDAGATRLAEQSTRGQVLGPGNGPAVGAPVFVDGGYGSVERVTTDSEGQFRALLKLRRNRHAMLLICVPGGIPQVALPLDTVSVATRYQVTALPPHWHVHDHIREQGWLPPIPRECLAGAAKP